MRHMTLVLMALMLVPTAQAITLVSVDTQRYTETTYENPFSDTYSFSFANTLFQPPPIFLGSAEFGADFGEVTKNHLVHWTTSWKVVDENGVTVYVNISGVGGKNWAGESTRGWDVNSNSSIMWKKDNQIVGEAFATFIYQDSHILQYIENATVKVPVDRNGVQHWDTSLGYDAGFNEHWGHSTTDVTLSKGALVFIAPDDGAAVFTHRNSTYTKYWIANMTHPSSWVMSTSYIDRTPSSLHLNRRFETQTSAIGSDTTAQADGCSVPVVSGIIGFCPTLAGIAGHTASFLPLLVGNLVSIVNPQWGGFFTTAGNIVGEFVSAYFFTLTLLGASPGKLFILVVGTASGVANIVGGLRGDLWTVIELNIKFMKILTVAVFWYFYMYWLMLKFALETAIKIFQVIAQFATAFNPEILGIKI